MHRYGRAHAAGGQSDVPLTEKEFCSALGRGWSHQQGNRPRYGHDRSDGEDAHAVGLQEVWRNRAHAAIISRERAIL